MKLREKYSEYILYFLVGLLVTAVDWAVYSLLSVFAGFNVTSSNAAAWSVAVILAFILNKALVFKSNNWSLNVIFRELSLFIGGRILSGAFEIGMVPLLLSLGLDQTYWGIPGFAAKFITTIVTMILNYILSKYAVFSNRL